jgi:hypothetical protein
VYGKILKVFHVLEGVVSIVNFIRYRGLNHRQIASFPRGVKSVCEDLPVKQRRDNLMHLKLASLYMWVTPMLTVGAQNIGLLRSEFEVRFEDFRLCEVKFHRLILMPQKHNKIYIYKSLKWNEIQFWNQNLLRLAYHFFVMDPKNIY